MKKRKNYLNLLLAVCLLSLVAGCRSRMITYTDPNGFEIKYKSDLAASEEQAKTVLVKTPNGWLIFVGNVSANNDSLKFWLLPYGGASTTDKSEHSTLNTE